MTNRYVTPRQAAQLLERDVGQIEERLAVGELVSVQVPGNGIVIPLSVVPPYHHVHEEE